MRDARSRLLLAIVVSAALHLLLIYGIAVRAPAPLTAPIAARLQPEAAPLGGLPTLADSRASLEPISVATTHPIPLAGGLPPTQAIPRPTPAPPPAAQLRRPVLFPTPPPDAALPSVTMPLLADPTWYSAQQLDVYPRALGAVQPAYPGQAANAGIGGEVTLLLMVDEAGSVEEVAVAQAVPQGYFEAAAIAAFRTARFAPAQKDGRSVRSRILVRVSFDPASVARDQQTSLSR